jgi:cyclase
MLRARVIPCLLLKGAGLVKTIGFKSPQYVGDPINAVRIFNEKEVDELILLDIEASRQARELNYDQIRDIVSEAFMPVTLRRRRPVARAGAATW